MRTPKVTVCLPTKNGNKFLENTLKSILSQTFKNFQILISDNNSNSKTKKILKRFSRNKKIKIYEQKKTISPTENLNFLIKKTQSNYFVIIHDDDFWNKDFLKEGMKLIIKNKKNIGVFGQIKRFKNKKIYKCEKEGGYFDKNFEERIENFLKINLGDKYLFAIFNKKKIKNFHFSTKILSPEIVFIYNAILNGKIINSKKMIYYKRQKKIRNLQEIRNFYSIKKNYLIDHGAMIAIFFDLLKKFQVRLLCIFILYRIPFVRFLFNKKLKQI